jgi:DNA-binding protein H-NS
MPDNLTNLVADMVADMEAYKEVVKEVDSKLEARITNAHTVKSTIIATNHAERVRLMGMTQEMVIQSDMTCAYATNAVTQGTSWLTAPTANMPAINVFTTSGAMHQMPPLEIDM